MVTSANSHKVFSALCELRKIVVSCYNYLRKSAEFPIPLKVQEVLQKKKECDNVETIILDTAIKFGAGRYRQGQDILENAGEEIRRFGRHVFIVAGKRAWAAVEKRLTPSLQAAGLDWVLTFYDGPCSYEAAQDYAHRCQAEHCDEVIGVGGGRIMDFAKAVAEYAQVGTINIPTSMSTCAPFTCMSVMYTPEGGKKDCWRFTHELDACLVDTQVIAQCPIRYNAAGILDAMAKRIEIQNGKPVMRLQDNPIDLYSAFRWAEFTYEMLAEFGPQAIADNRNQQVTKALEDVCFVNIAVTGTIANITKSFSQSAIAHSMYDGIRTFFPKESASAIHGEIVAVALFAQLHYNRLFDEIPKLKAFMRGMDMPMTLEELGVDATPENLKKLEDYLIDSPYVAATPESYAMLHEAMAEML